ncbi:TPA: hypothetical protein ACOJPK_000056 [Pseudomonas putida]|uniref:hypothetical protein n=1 Tax=Pseudomonas sp. TaxID=306 RepID=UPI00264785C8|nr:hypothetical protein [Pseudomonas sp.]MDN5518392.1 hypothetical protein [Pseudomonas sp.]MDN5531643.1 hypothetical protein [Pseudomonas sp.]
MEKLLSILESARLETISMAGKMVTTYNLRPSDFPICGLNMLNSECVTLMEIITQYTHLWNKIQNTLPADFFYYNNPKDENAQRISNICRAGFISSMSAIEYCAKETTAKFLNSLTADAKKDIHLSFIITESFKENIINEESKTLWQGLNQIRNCLVHNNGIASNNKTYAIDDTITISMTKGEPISSTLSFFPTAIKALVHKYDEWARAILEKSDYKPDVQENHQRTLNDAHKEILATLAKQHPEIKLMTIRQKSKESQNISSSIEKILSRNGWIIEQFITQAPWEEQRPTISLHIKHKNLEAFDTLTQLMQNLTPQTRVGTHDTPNHDIVLDLGIIACSPSQQVKDAIGESQTVIDPRVFDR